MSKDVAPPKLSGLDSIVINPLGNGAGSQVLLISDRATGLRYALKIAKRDEEDDSPTKYIDQTRREFEAAQKLNHPATAENLAHLATHAPRQPFTCRLTKHVITSRECMHALMHYDPSGLGSSRTPG